MCVCVCVCVCVSDDVSVVWCGGVAVRVVLTVGLGSAGLTDRGGEGGSRPSPVLYKRAPLFQINHIHRILPLLS